MFFMARILLQIDILEVFYEAGEFNDDPVNDRMLNARIIQQHPRDQVCSQLDFKRVPA